MILLGSIDRLELLALCDWWLSPERRLLMQVSRQSCGLVLGHELPDLCVDLLTWIWIQGQSLQEQNSDEQTQKHSWESFAFVDEEEEDSQKVGSSCLSSSVSSSVRCPSPDLFVACRPARCRRRGTAPCLPLRPPRSPL